MHDLHNNSRAVRVVSPVAVGTTGTGKTGAVIDRQGFGGVDSPRCSIGQHSASCSMIGGTTRTARVLRTSP